MKKLKIVWTALWAIIAAPFGYVIVLCALIGSGPSAASDWAEEQGLPWPRS